MYYIIRKTENPQTGDESLTQNNNSTNQFIFSNQEEMQANNIIQFKRSKSMFTKEEDKKLIKAVHKYGEHNWKFISSFFENRTGRQCRERWKKFLCPSLNHSPWTKKEDDILLQKYYELGPKWSLISKYFQNRTDINVKTRFTVLSRKRKKEEDFENQSKKTNTNINEICVKKSKNFKKIVCSSNIPQPITHLDINNTIKQIQNQDNDF